MIRKGTILGKRYEVLEQIGSGGFGTVFRARDRQTGAFVAIKVLHQHLAEEPQYLKRFHREIIIARALASKHIVRVLGSGQDNGMQYIVMELVDGQTLKDIIQAKGRLSVEDSLAVGRDVAVALAEAHRRGVIHRDIKPHNIFVSSQGIKVGDFGIARVDDLTSATAYTGYMGTVSYGAPEQIRGDNPDGRSDVYALGIVLYEMLSGQVPFHGSSLSVMDAQLHEPPPPLESVPAPVRTVVMRCLEKDPALRYQTANELSNDLSSLLQLGAKAPADATVHLLDAYGDRATQPGPRMSAPSPAGEDQATIPRAAGSRGSPPPRLPTAGLPASAGWSRRSLVIVGGTTACAVVGFAVAAIILLMRPTGSGDNNTARSSPNPSAAASTDNAGTDGLPMATPLAGILYISDASGDAILFSAPSADAAPTTLASGVSAQHPSISPDGKNLLFVRGDNSSSSVYLRDLAAGSEREVVNGGADMLRSPIWVSNDEFLYQESEISSGNDVPGSTSIRRHPITRNEPIDGSDWQSDATVIAAQDLRQPPLSLDESARVQAFDVDAAEVPAWLAVQICYDEQGREVCGVYRLDVGAPPATLRSVVPLESGRVSGFPAISPDGTQVAVQTYYRDTQQESPIELWTTEGNQLRSLPNTSLAASLYFSKMAWAPDGNSLVIEHHDAASGDWLYVQKVDGSQPRPLYPGRQPAWAQIQ
jgi:serine/threonine protein kinase